MNARQLAALLAAGLITPAQHATLAADPAAPAPTLRVQIPALAVRLAEEPAPGAEPEEREAGGSREIVATVAIYGQLIPSHNMILDAGCLEPRDIARRQVKVLRDHDHGDPLGYVTDLDAASLDATLYIVDDTAGNGDRALAEARDGLRDGCSVGFQILEYSFDEDDVMHVTRAEFYEVSLCALPAIADAGVISVSLAQTPTPKGTPLMNREQLAAALAAGTITQAEHDAALTVLTAREAGIDPALAAGPQAVQIGGGTLDVQDRPRSLSEVSREVAELAQRRDLPGIMLALQTHVVADDPGTAYYGRPDWIGEVWQARVDGRPWIDSLGTPSPLTGGKIEGFILEDQDKLRPEKYAGGGAAIATGKMKTKKVDTEPDRWAFGTSLDRIFIDLGTEDLVASLFRAIAAGYDVVSDVNVAAAILEAATVPMTTGATPAPVVDPHILTSIARGAADLRKLGATIDHIKMGEGAFEQWTEQKIADLPAWLANQLGFVDLREGTSEIGDLHIAADIRMEDDEIALYDKRAAVVYESPQIQLEAVNIPNGKIDIGFFTYGGLLLADARAIQKRTVNLA